MKNLVVGVDVGGTNIKMGLVSARGKIIARNNLITKTYVSDQKKLIVALCDAVRELLLDCRVALNDVAGIGVGLPGLVDPQKGRVVSLTNIPGWRDVPLKSIMRKRLRVPVFLDNDVNLITLGEWRFGAGVGVDDLLCMTLGTGVGAGLVLNGRIYRGAGFCAGELGHMPLNEKGPSCNCGGVACLERYVGNRYLLRRIHKIFKNNKLSIEDVYALAVKSDARALHFWEETAVTIGNGLVGVVNLLNPRRIIIGGGVSANYRFLSRTIQRIIRSRAMKTPGAMARIIKAKLGNDAGLLGARVLVSQGGC